MKNDLKLMLRDELADIDAQTETLASRKSAILVLLDRPATIAEIKAVAPNSIGKPVLGSTAKEVAVKLAAARSPAARPVAKGHGQGRRADLSEQDIAAIRERAASGGKSHKVIGSLFGVSRSTVANIVSRKGRFA